MRVARSQVTLGPASDPARYVGRLETLRGSRLEARLRPAQGRPVRLSAVLGLGEDGRATASVRAEAAT